MGLLSKGQPLSWEDTKKNARIVQKLGVQQFISLYKRLKDRKGDTLKWGDEVEYTLVYFDEKQRRAKLSLLGPKILKILQQPEIDSPDKFESKWMPEYGSYMIEGTPGVEPYGGSYTDFRAVEANMALRRQQLYEVLKGTSVVPLGLTVYPRLGCSDFTNPSCPVTPEKSASRSLFYPDEAIWEGHPRFVTLTRNIRERRSEKVQILVPIFKDTNTPSPFVEEFVNDFDGTAARRSQPDHIYMDAMGFGMGCSCLQVTIQATDINEARHLYDQLAVLCPIILALSAGSPIFRGYLSETECRFPVIASAVDDRTPEERGIKPLKEDKFVIPKSRYDCIDMYLASGEYNDLEVKYDEELYQMMREQGIDHLLAKHVGHLFIRDPISVFAEKLEDQDVKDGSDHFENIQSTNWQSMRFKPPPPKSSIGWRVEFRPMEMQITDFENAAFVVFVVLLTRAILSFKLNFYVPISKMEENMRRAVKRDAARQAMFYFRKNVIADDDDSDEVGTTVDGSSSEEPAAAAAASTKSHDHEYTLMSVDKIMNGKDEFPGVIPLVRMYVNSIDIDVETRCTILQYLSFLSKKSSGEFLTTATWIRQFVRSHPEYKHDSVVTDSMVYDLLSKIKDITKGTCTCRELTGNLSSRLPMEFVKPSSSK